MIVDLLSSVAIGLFIGVIPFLMFVVWYKKFASVRPAKNKEREFTTNSLTNIK